MSLTKTALWREWAIVAMLAAPLIHAQRPAAQTSPQASATFKIAGRVVDALSGAPLAEAHVRLIDTQNRNTRIHVLTEENGVFEFKNLPAGKFALLGTRRGYMRSSYDQHDAFSTAIVTGAGMETENLVLRLTPLARIFGKVSDEFGEPVRNAMIWLYTRDDQNGYNRVVQQTNTQTDDLGTYEFPTVGPATYYISASGKPWYAVYPPPEPVPGQLLSQVDSSLDVVYPSTFYNGATDSDAATPITPKGGEQLQVDIHLAPTAGLKLILRIPSNDDGHSYSIPNLSRREFDSSVLSNSSGRFIAPGVYEMTGLVPGRYSVLSQGTNTTSARYAELDLRNNGQEVDVTQMEPAVDVRVSVKVSSGALPQEVFVGLQDGQHQVENSYPVDASGHTELDNIRPGKYSLVAFCGNVACSITRMVAEGREMAGREITIEPGSTQELTVVLTQGVVAVEGFVKRGTRPVAGAMVVLVPDNPEGHQDLIRRDQSNLDGSFVVRGVIPGSYRILALEHAWTMPWREPGALTPYLAKSQALTVGSLMQRTVVLPEAIEAQLR
ncbi:MAG TPA: carboxypeptidase regulatory-like domain-containing protein [Candidatus Eisenbacteria bacterium]|jgi:hypothetical protein|nr:carboxypeptidase regulatory-like domain-containing protein [Candidatus Eisenbacteria bacterium]